MGQIVKTKPILYATEMVQALLEGRKTQTRRTKGLNYINKNPDNWRIEYLDSIWAHGKDFEIKELKKPYDVGDILWVRETFSFFESNVDTHAKNMFKEKSSSVKIQYKSDNKISQEFKVSYSKAVNAFAEIMQSDLGKTIYKPSIFMPKEAARIFLKVTNIRVERLKDISNEDCKSEGIKRDIYPPTGEECFYFYTCNDLRDDSYLDCPKTSFYSLWKSIYSQKSWDDNPWVWVIEFERVEKPENF